MLRNNTPILTTVFVVLAILYSCNKWGDCGNPNFSFHFKGFDSTDLSDIRLYKYNIGNGFVHIVDSVQAGITSSPNHWDTGYIMNTGTYDQITITTGFEWQLRIMATGNSYKFSNLNYQQRRGKIYRPGPGCANSGSFRMNDSIYTIDGEKSELGVELNLYR